MSAKQKSNRLTLLLNNDIIAALDREIRRIKKIHPGVRPSRTSVARGLLHRSLSGRNASTRPERLTAYKSLMLEAKQWEEKAVYYRNSDHQAVAKSAFLMAAAIQLEALAVLQGPTETAIMSTLIESIGLIKAGTNYKNLPQVPSR
jgi:hypothetical protein